MQHTTMQPQMLGQRAQGAALRSHLRGAPGARSSRGPPAGRRLVVTPVGFFGRGVGAATGSRDSQDTLVSDGAIKSLSPEARRIFREAQDNIIELNKSRLRALEELKAARQKIAELEEKLEGAVSEAGQVTAQLQQLGPNGARAAAEATAAMAEATARSPSPPQQQHAAPPPPPPPPAYAGNTITVVYETGWSSAYLHYNVDNKGWTDTPGKQMQDGSQQFPDKKVISVPGRRMEFVINNGGSDWDKPNPYGGSSSNYVVSEPGTYRVKNGKVAKLV